jgi:hypothetical protein
VTQGEVVLLDAGQVHTGQGFDQRGFGFRMLYVPESTFREIAQQSRYGGSGSLHFRTAVLNNVHARNCLLAAHRSLDSGAPILEVESRFVNAFAYLLTIASSWRAPSTSTSAPATSSRGTRLPPRASRPGCLSRRACSNCRTEQISSSSTIPRTVWSDSACLPTAATNLTCKALAQDSTDR